MCTEPSGQVPMDFSVQHQTCNPQNITKKLHLSTLYVYGQNKTKVFSCSRYVCYILSEQHQNDYVGTEWNLLCAPAYNTQSRTIELHQNMKVLWCKYCRSIQNKVLNVHQHPRCSYIHNISSLSTIDPLRWSAIYKCVGSQQLFCISILNQQLENISDH